MEISLGALRNKRDRKTREERRKEKNLEKRTRKNVVLAETIKKEGKGTKEEEWKGER